MILQIIKLVPLILPVIIKLFSALSELNKPKDNAVTKDQKQAIDRFVREAKTQIEDQIQTTIEEYRPKVRDVAKTLPSEEELKRRRRVEQLERELLRDQEDYKRSQREKAAN